MSKNIVRNNIKAKLFLYALVEKSTSKYLDLNLNKGNTGTNSLIKNWSKTKYSKRSDSIEFVPTKTLDEIAYEAKINF